MQNILNIMYKDDEPITQIGNSSLIHLTGCFLNEINPVGFVKCASREMCLRVCVDLLYFI